MQIIKALVNMFVVAKVTVCVIVHEVCDAIVEILMKRFIPSNSQLTDTLNRLKDFMAFHSVLVLLMELI